MLKLLAHLRRSLLYISESDPGCEYLLQAASVFLAMLHLAPMFTLLAPDPRPPDSSSEAPKCDSWRRLERLLSHLPVSFSSVYIYCCLPFPCCCPWLYKKGGEVGRNVPSTNKNISQFNILLLIPLNTFSLNSSSSMVCTFAPGVGALISLLSHPSSSSTQPIHLNLIQNYPSGPQNPHRNTPSSICLEAEIFLSLSFLLQHLSPSSFHFIFPFNSIIPLAFPW